MGTKLAAGEETLIYRNLIRNKLKVLYFPEASVGHRLKPREYLAENIEKQFLDSADSLYYLSKTEAKRLILSRPAYTLRTALIAALTGVPKWIVSTLQSNSVDAFYYKLVFKRSMKLLKLWILNQ